MSTKPYRGNVDKLILHLVISPFCEFEVSDLHHVVRNAETGSLQVKVACRGQIDGCSCRCVIYQLVGAAFGAAGQRCMALCTAVFVGEAKQWIPEFVAKSKQLTVNAGQCLHSLFICEVNIDCSTYKRERGRSLLINLLRFPVVVVCRKCLIN